ncbi:MAG: hypothetical protein HY780_03655 [Chloroflexi bacterium]|nr:hypothetical protein [Chloroflexota bacterium]
MTEKTVIEVSDPSGDSVPAYSLLGKPFEIKAHKEKNGEDLKQFPKELSIFVSYEELDIPAEVEGSLYLYWFDENLGEWAALPTVVNKETKTLHALTDHFTVFDIGVNNWQSSRLPTVDSFQVSEFTGAGTYSYPINVPPGPGGFQPNLTLTYNSQVVDQATLNTPASWVGMGWSLDVGSIEIDLHGTPDWTYDDTYLLNLNGVSTRIVKDTNGVYHTTDENFLRIAFDGSKWTIWDKKGDVYYFDYGLSYPYQVGSGCPSTDTGVEWHVYRWPLTRVRNIFNQEIQYLYYQQTKSVKLQQYYTGLQTCKTIYNDAATATYLAAITYANGKYRIRFERGARNDYPAVWDTDGAFHAYEKYRLQNVYIEQDVDGNGAYETILRRYELAYKDNNASDIIFPGYTWTKGGKTNTLALIREYGINSVSALPPVTFTYGDNLHLTRVDNGYGGSVQFNYNLWYYPSHARKSHTVEQRFGRSGFPCKVDNSDPWHARSGEVSCGDGSGDPLHIWGSLGVARAFNFSNPNVLPQYGANSMRDLVRPGGVYKITANIGWTSAVTNVKVGINDGIRDHLQDVTTNGGLAAYYISLPSDASTVQAIVSETGGSGLGNIHPEYAAVSYYKIQLLPAVYRVSEKIISDGNGHEYKYSYSYSGAAVNDTITSPNGVCSYTVDPIYNSVVDNADCQEFFEKFSEFRGHAEVTVTAPDGTKTITRFHQDDTLKGRPKSVLTSDGKNTVQGTFYEYISTSLSIGRYAYCNVCFPYRGLGRTWTFTSAVENHIYNNNGAFYNASRTVYAYDPAYGNILTETEQSLVTDNWTTYRAKEYNYYPKDTVDRYLVSLPARIRTLDAGGGVLSSTLFVYDNLAGYNTQPINGVLTGVRTRMSVDGYQWSHVNYGYDAWGNRTSETTYSDYSAWNIAPANGARTTTTAYDTVFHVYPTSQTAPLGMTTKWEYDYDKNGTNDYIFGVPTKEIDPNNNATSAAYDAFGRMIALIRPGDDSALPTITIAYQDAFPFTTTIRQKIEGNQYYEVTRIYDGMGRQTRMISGGVISDTVYASAIETWQSMPYTGGETPAYTRTVVNPSTRTTTVIAPDGSQTVTQNNGLTTTVTDARGNSTVSIKDVWGRTVFVDAPENPDVAYEYDPMDRLIMVKRGSLLPPTDPSVNPGYTGLISWWSLDESGGVRNDSHGANHLADNNTVTAIAGRQSNAAKFTLANAEFLNIPDNPAVSMGSNALMTVCAWVKLDSANSTGVQNIVSKRGATNGTWEYFLRYDGRIDRFVFLVTSNGSSGTMAEARANSFGAPVLNTWYFVCGGYDGSSAWVSVNAGVRDTVPFSAGIFDGAADLRIGSGYNAEYLDGALDELILYKRALTQHEIAWLYNKGAGRSYADLASPPPPPPPSGNEIITTITYDHGGRKTALSDPDMGTWTYSYDALGNLTRQTDARGQRICLYYDSLNRLIGKHYRADDNCPANPTFDVTYSYDQGTYGKGHRTSMTDASGSTTWLYDARGRVTKETKVISGSSFVTEWTYNSADLPATMTYPGGEVVTTAYNSRMLPISVTGADNYVPSMTYDSASRPRTRALGSGLTQTYTYYPWNQQGGRLQTLATGSLQNLTYAYDANGNILSIADTVNNETQTFTTYDALDRLTSWTLNPNSPTTATGNG